MARKRPLPAPAPEPAANLAGLVQACKDDPDDDGLRLILADYLEDHGEPERAELIRLGIQIDRPRDDPASRARAHARTARLHRDHDQRWLAGLQLTHGRAHFNRGMIALEIGTNELSRGDVLASLAAVAPWPERMRLRFTKPKQLVDYLSRDVAPRFPFLDLGESQIGREQTEAIAKSPLAPHLRGLRVLTRGRTYQALVPLCQQGTDLTGLRSLILRSAISPAEAQALVTAPFASSLRSLTLHGAYPHPETLEVLAQAESLAGLQHLNFDGQVNGRGVRHLANSPHLRNLQTLRLDNASLDDESGIVLAQSPILKSVRHLDLTRNFLGDNTLVALAESPFTTNLEQLDLGCAVNFTEPALQVFTQSPHLTNLRRLELWHWNRISRIGPGTLAIFARASNLKHLEVLNLSGHQGLAEGDFAALGRSDQLPALRDVNLGSIPTTRHTAETLVDSPLGNRLRRLRLGGLCSGSEVITYLANAPSLRHLEALELVYNSVDSASLITLAESTALERLVWLQIPLPSDSEAALIALAAGRGLPSLAYLTFSNGVPKYGDFPSAAMNALASTPRRDDFFRVAIPWHLRYPPELYGLTQDIPQMSPLL